MQAGLLRAIGASCLFASFAFNAPAQATNYNVLTFGNYTGQNSDVEGALAAGGNVTLQNYSVGSSLTSSSDGSNTLVAGGTIDWTNGQLFHGNAVASNFTGNFNTPNGTKTVGTGLNFTQAKTLYSGYSTSLAGKAANGSVTSQYGTMTLTGTASGLNVFDVVGADIASLNSLNLIIPSSAYALINITGNSASFANMGINVNGTPYSNILFNFGGSSLSFGGIGFLGSMLAPDADVSFSNGQFNGQLIAESVNGTGEFHNYALDPAAFFSNVPATPAPEPGTWAMMIVGFGAIGAAARHHNVRRALIAK